MATEHDSLHKRRHHSDKKHKKEERDHTKDKHKDKKNSHRHSKIRKNSRLDKKQQHHSNKRHKKTASSSSKKSGGGFDHHGVATFYSPDKGSCGWRNTKDDLIAAVNKDDMDNKKHESDKNPNCGRMIEIENNKGDTVKVKVVDTCPGCKKGSLDLSPAAFIKLASYKQGVVPIKWKYLD
ncbi:RlpA-like double-psi beta-barrel-protein domain-containing protein-containing protein [Cokeromyces recurvatus]|uniref:RlpA-like double-psi beta-barrel-protein domain-containing protein-containing protein n=1 Tax=Cokeromyces recurvatus TaxID=90255 RepID=UPI00222003B0|nr:RlpA-like double-psi beta-barrel-protein domain-containing protein-containing protein [Cokeromyces recurvatus]KAI7906866.1 RlpA-like double-psi beta-barrel-protein domain-containing protein-containing protein [Cokeromyces recurvatus]